MVTIINRTPVFIPHSSHNLRGSTVSSCNTYMEQFDPKVATVEQKNTYAECVKLVHTPKVTIPDWVDYAFWISFIVVAAIVYIKTDGDMADKIAVTILAASMFLTVAIVTVAFLI
jgi:hypothetical protein